MHRYVKTRFVGLAVRPLLRRRGRYTPSLYEKRPPTHPKLTNPPVAQPPLITHPPTHPPTNHLYTRSSSLLSPSLSGSNSSLMLHKHHEIHPAFSQPPPQQPLLHIGRRPLPCGSRSLASVFVQENWNSSNVVFDQNLETMKNEASFLI